jgi:hypothetical protein
MLHHVLSDYYSKQLVYNDFNAINHNTSHIFEDFF